MPAACFDTRISQFLTDLHPPRMPGGIQLLNPYKDARIQNIVRKFYREFYHDNHPRRFLLGINPGRHGAGLTGIAFTDPVQLSEVLGITHHLPMKPESSATFIYAVIDAYGGAYSFYRNFYVGSVCPLGFTREGNNCNYYDDPSLAKRMTPFIVASISAQVAAGADRKLAISLGEGKNYRFLSSLNDQHGWFEQIAALPHPRFVMQYKRKQLQQYIDKYLALLLEP